MHNKVERNFFTANFFFSIVPRRRGDVLRRGRFRRGGRQAGTRGVVGCRGCPIIQSFSLVSSVCGAGNEQFGSINVENNEN